MAGSRALAAAALACVLAAGAAGCGGAAPAAAPAHKTSAAQAPGGGKAAPAAAPARVLRFNTNAPQNDIGSQVDKYWGDEVTRLTHGQIRFRYYYAGSLVPTTQAFSAVQEGTVDIADVPASYITGQVPAVSILEVPYAIPLASGPALQFAHAVDPVLRGIYAKSGQELLFANLTSSVPLAIVSHDKLFTSAAAFHGSLIRTAGKWQAASMTAWGAKPVVIGLGSLYTALQRGTVPSTLLIFSLTRSFKLYEVAKYLTDMKASINYLTDNMNLKEWNSLTPAEQAAMRQAGRDAEAYSLKLATQASATDLTFLHAQGMQVGTVSTQEITQLRGLATSEVWPQIEKIQGADGQKVMNVVKQYQQYVH